MTDAERLAEIRDNFNNAAYCNCDDFEWLLDQLEAAQQEIARLKRQLKGNK